MKIPHDWIHYYHMVIFLESTPPIARNALFDKTGFGAPQTPEIKVWRTETIKKRDRKQENIV